MDRKKLCLLGLLGVFIIIPCAVQEEFKTKFVNRCNNFKGYDCQNLWSLFEQAYTNKDPCMVPPQAYHPLIAAAPFKPAENTVMFWSKTKDVVLGFAQKRKDCFVILEHTLLGSVLDGLTWCGKKGSKDTLTTGCPGWSDCENNPVRSFWKSASAAFAKAVRGQVTVMLSGSIATPYDPNSVFATIEVKNLNPSEVKGLKVVLVKQKNAVTNCNNASLKNLKNDLGKIKYECKDVPESQIQKCASDPKIPCDSCWGMTFV